MRIFVRPQPSITIIRQNVKDITFCIDCRSSACPNHSKTVVNTARGLSVYPGKMVFPKKFILIVNFLVWLTGLAVFDVAANPRLENYAFLRSSNESCELEHLQNQKYTERFLNKLI